MPTTTLFGLPAVEVTHPDGTSEPYLVRAVPPLPGAWREWLVTSPDGKVYRVSEPPAGRWSCTCKWWVHRGRYKCLPGGAYSDKHINAVLGMLAREVVGAADGRTGAGVPDARGGRALPPDGSQHPEAAYRDGRVPRAVPAVAGRPGVDAGGGEGVGRPEGDP